MLSFVRTNEVYRLRQELIAVEVDKIRQTRLEESNTRRRQSPLFANKRVHTGKGSQQQIRNDHLGAQVHCVEIGTMKKLVQH